MTDPTTSESIDRRKRIVRALSLGLAGLLGVIMLVVAFVTSGRGMPGGADPAGQGESIDVRPIVGRPIEVLPAGYASSKSCKECHPGQHRSWHASYHRTMTQVVDSNTAPNAIRNAPITVAGETYRFHQEGERFFVEFRDPLAHGETRRRQLVMMTGSHHMHVFWYESDFKRTPGQLPIIYLIDQQRWIPRRSAFLRPPDMPKTHELGRWNQTCSHCHSTHPRQRLDRETRIWDTHVVEFGIACEACHGQGAEHVRRHSSERGRSAVDATADDSIISPLSVSHRASSDICGRCHSISLFDYQTLGVDQFFAHGSPFQPGQKLDDSSFIRVIRAGAEHRDSDLFRRWIKDHDPNGSFWSDGMPRVSGREYNGLIESGCFQRGEMSCLSCHTMHPDEDQPLATWRDDQLKPGMRGDQACLQCHDDYADRIVQHTHHAADSHGSRCLNCHMPHTTYGLLKTIRSHQISSPSVVASVTTGRPSACTLCHLDRSFDWIASRLHEWYDQPKIKLPTEAKETSAAVHHFLKGNAAQRAIQAAAFGWPPAQQASGTRWMEPLLLIQMNDPYDAVRIISEKSFRTLPGRESFVFDALAGRRQRVDAINSAVADIYEQRQLEPNQQVLVDADGVFDVARAQRLVRQRDPRPIDLRE